MNQPAETAVLYSAVLRPHRSAGLTAAHRRGTGRGVAGDRRRRLPARAWPVLPFLGLEVLLLYAALRFNQRVANACEAINLTRKALTVRRLDHWGKQSDFSFPPYWLQVNLLEMPGQDNWLELRTHGRSLAIASFLLPHERRELALTLRRALGRVTNLPPA